MNLGNGTPRKAGDNAMLKSPVRAFQWRKMLDEGVHATLEDLPERRAWRRPT
jgi:hypothetical protein